jgi:uncharacterized protein YxjI
VRLHIKQRIFTWGDCYYVYDELGETKYEVRSDLLSLGHQIRVYTHRPYETCREIGCIRQKLLTLLPTFEIEIGGQVVGTIRNKFTLLQQNYEVDCQGWHVEGDFLGWNYRVIKGNQEILSISKEWLALSDIYTLVVHNPADEIPALLLVLAIDAANCSHND